MLSNDDNSWLFTCLFGIVVLVMAGVGLSILVDKRFEFSSNAEALKREIAADEVKVTQLRASERSKSLRLGDDLPGRQRDARALHAVNARRKELAGRKIQLLAAKADLETGLAELERTFAATRGNVRQSIWAKAIGERLGNLQLGNDREYKDAVITRITVVGLEIRHSDGMARIQAPDLPPELQERFQWTAEERLAALQQERQTRRR